MSFKKIATLTGCLLFITLQNAWSQKRWDGGAGDNLWSSRLNWETDSLPVLSDSVLLDNSLISGNYSVILPHGVVNISISTIIIKPTDSALIRLILPSGNTAIPGLSLLGAGGIRLFSGGEFQNSSGGSPGLAVTITDSLYIFNGGKYIHNTSNAHAALVTRLSRAAGTEKGSFEFNVPGAASYTVSLVSRVYGNLILNAAAAGGNKSYLSSGSSNALINGDCTINAGVNFSLDFTATISIKGSLINKGNFNLSTAPNNNVVKITKDLVCTGAILESSTGLPVIELNGNDEQILNVPGAINNSVTLRINGNTVRLLNALVLPYKLEFAMGRLVTSTANLLILAPACSITADSTNNNCFVDGPLRKLGLANDSYFHFPVGKGTTKRWFSARNSSGDLTVEYFKINPNTLSPVVGVGLNHVSKLEYWAISSVEGVSCHPELSFDNVNSGGVTNMDNLRVARLTNEGAWLDAGNIGVSGSAGSSGSVTGIQAAINPYSVNYFTLASNVLNQNPLPLHPPLVSGRCRSGNILLTWEPAQAEGFLKIELEKSVVGNHFVPIAETNFAHSGSWLVDHSHSNTDLFRLKMHQRTGGLLYSKQLRLGCSCGQLKIKAFLPEENAFLIESDSTRTIRLVIVGMDGKIAALPDVFVPSGRHKISLSAKRLVTGYYQVFALSSAARTNPILFFKP